MKEVNALTFLILGPILDHIFGSKKDKLFCPVLFSIKVCPMPSVILCYICRVKA